MHLFLNLFDYHHKSHIAKKLGSFTYIFISDSMGLVGFTI